MGSGANVSFEGKRQIFESLFNNFLRGLNGINFLISPNFYLMLIYCIIYLLGRLDTCFSKENHNFDKACDQIS